ncbi:MAG: nuclear transport factor 2 family protein [Ferruginibacter sp.]|nr:nuclear transport factor 2 family protein [Ferruginibacter sp.]
MIKNIITFLIVLQTQSAFSQTKKDNNKQEIEKVLYTFMDCLVHKDSTKFYSLFYTDPVVWVGITHKKSYANELKTDNTAKDNFRPNYKSFYKYFYTKEVEEKFYNIKIFENGYIATVIFDYSFWEKAKKLNWGKESWALIKTNEKWKITSVIFSSEDETINPEPKIKIHKK